MRDRQIDPIAIGADFKLQVFEGVGRVRLQEGLRYIAVPQLVTPAVRTGIGEYGNVPVNATEADEQRLRCPQQANLRGTLGIRVFAGPVAIIADRGRFLPGRARRETLAVGRLV